jgi:tRNA(Ile)-lysidine synthase
MKRTSATAVSPSEARAAFERLAHHGKLALAVSGGPDSLALMHLAAEWRAASGAGPELCVLTVDHKLREDAREEALMVGRLAARLGLPHAILAWEGGQGGRALQARARAARYDLMTAYCHAHAIPALATAHTLDDQAETFLMRLKRGSGLDGLAAIPPSGTWSGIAIERPLLEMPKARLIATLEARGIGYASDPSNADLRFERVQVRGQKDALAALGLTHEAIALSARRLRRAREALDRGTDHFLASASEISGAGFALVDRQALFAAPQEIALRALARLIATVGGGEEPVRLAKLEALLASLGAEPGKAHTLSRCRIGPQKGKLGIFREVRRDALPALSLEPGTRALWDNRFRIELGAEARESLTVKALGEQGLRDLCGNTSVLSSLPRLAGRTLPACFRGNELIGLPLLASLPGSGHGLASACTASFIGAEAGGAKGTALARGR